jgi:hypothetical protein
MATNNSWNSTNPAGVTSGGTGLATLTTAYGVVCAGTTATGPLQNAGTGTAGQVFMSNGSAALGSFQTVGGVVTWHDQTTTPVTMVAGNAYSANNAGLVTLNVPATAAVGDEFQVQGQGAGGWLVRANTGQVINFGSSPTTSAGSLASTNRYDGVKFVCTVANTTFAVMFAIGNLTVA